MASPSNKRLLVLQQQLMASSQASQSATPSTTASVSPTAAAASAATASPSSSALLADDGLVVRRLELGDYDKGYLRLLAQLTTVGRITKEDFEKQFRRIDAMPDIFVVHVIEDKSSGRVVACATLVIEPKFVHECGKAGHIEDVVVDTSVRGKRLGMRVVQSLLDVGREAGCYKVILDCAPHNVKFYNKLGFVQKEVQMAHYFPDANDSIRDGIWDKQ